MCLKVFLLSKKDPPPEAKESMQELLTLRDEEMLKKEDSM